MKNIINKSVLLIIIFVMSISTGIDIYALDINKEIDLPVDSDSVLEIDGTDLSYIDDKALLNQLFNRYLKEIIAHKSIIQPNLEYTIDLMKARNEELIYLRYPGVLKLEGTENTIEYLNIAVINEVLGLDIKVKSVEDFGMPDTFESVEYLLRTGQADFAGMYLYSNIENENIARQYYKTQSYSNRRVYLVSRNGEANIDYKNQKIGVNPNLNYVRPITNTKYPENEIMVVDKKLAKEKLEKGELDIYITEADGLEDTLVDTTLLYNYFEDTSFQPELTMITREEKYKGVIETINEIYSNEVMSYYKDYNLKTLVRNRYKLYESSLTEEEKQIKGQIFRVGMTDKKVLTERKIDENGLVTWEGFTIDYLNNLATVMDVRFICVDYTDLTYEDMLLDLAANRIDIVVDFPANIEKVIRNEYNSKGVQTVVSKPYLERQVNILKKVETEDLYNIKDLKFSYIGTTSQNQIFAETYLGDKIGDGYKKMIIYNTFDEAADALKNGDILYLIGSAGEKAYFNRLYETWVTDAYDKDSNFDNDKIPYVFLVASTNENKLSLLNTLNKGIMTLERASLTQKWFINEVDYFDMTRLEDMNRELSLIIFLIFLLVVIVAVIIFFVTRKNADNMRMLARNDYVTRLGNRYAFNKDIVSDERMYCMFLDIEKYKFLLEVQGEAKIEKLFVLLAERIKMLNSEYMFRAYRVGGDEFVFLIKYDEKLDIEDFIEYMLSIIKRPYTVNGSVITLNFKIGVAESSLANYDPAKLSMYANLMLNKSKEKDGVEYTIFTKLEKEKLEEIEKVENILDHSLKMNVIPYYQPTFNNETKEVIGCEVLARMIVNNKVKPASEFIKIAIKNEKASKIDMHIMEEVIKYRQTLLERGVIDTKFFFSINVSLQFLRSIDKRYIDNLKYIYSLEDLSFLQLEILEQDLSNADDIKSLDYVTDAKMKIAIDDFSIGHSSLIKLLELKFTTVKVDRSLMPSEANEDGKSLYISLINLISDFDVKVVACGIEKEEHFKFVTPDVAKYVQGFYFARAMNENSFTDYIQRDNQFFSDDFVEEDYDRY